MEKLESKAKKMCVFCHAQVAIETKICPFCRAHFDQVQLNQEKIPNKSSSGLSEKQTLDSLYPPPYQPKMEKIEEEKKEEIPNQIVSKPKSFILPVFLFSLGAQLFVFSLFLFFFSHEGILHLKWKASLWYLYSLISICLLIGSYKFFSFLELE